MSRFSGKTALVTGAGSGIGQAIATRLVRDGARVIITDVSGREDEVAKMLGDQAIARHLDVSQEEEVNAVEHWIAAEFGGLDILMNNAGVGIANGLVHELPMADFDKIMNVNVRGAFMVLAAGIRLMLESGGGAIVNTASIGGFRGTASASGYITSKGAVVMMTRVAALEYADRNIRINAVGPGTTKTPILDTAPNELLEMLHAQVPQKRLGTPEEIANIATFLADDAEASHVTGQIWLVDGGRSAG